jgi:hypothetical protein
MGKYLIIGGIFAAYLLFRFLSEEPKIKPRYVDVLSEEKYKIKGQWDK